MRENTAQFLAFSVRETLSAKITRQDTLIPAAAMPWSDRPTNSIGKAEVGAAVQSALPIIMSSTAALMV